MKIGVIGASGFAGAELLRLVAGHPELDLVVATGDSRAGNRIASLYPSLSGALGNKSFDTFSSELVDGLDLVFLALPHGASQALVPEIAERVGMIIDLAADFRLKDPALYPTWYGAEHACPEWLDRFVYGMPELFRSDILDAKLVAAPGCYVTSAAVPLAALVRAGAIETSGLIVDAASGVSGAGRPPKDNTTYAAVAGDFTPYGLLNHRHTPEMQQAIGAELLFTPHLAPMSRGILATCYARPVDPSLTTEAVQAILHQAYGDETFVVIHDSPIGPKAATGSNAIHISAVVDPRTGWVIAFGALDNLVKGAAGQAVQCANIMNQLPEATGLTAVGLYP